MKQALASLRNLLELPWTYSALCILGIFFFPEYCAPPLAILSLVFAYKDASKSGEALHVGINGKLIWIYILCMFFSVFYSHNRLSTLATFCMWVLMFCLYISLTTILKSRRRIFQFLVLLSAVFGLMGLIGCIQYFGSTLFGWDRSALQLWHGLDQFVYKLSPVDIHLDSYAGRISGTSSNPNMFAEYMVVLFPFVAAAIMRSKKQYTTPFCICALVLGLFSILFTFSRASYICILAILVSIFIFNPSYLKRKVYLFHLGAFLLFAAMILVLPNVFSARMGTLNASDSSINERIKIWGSVWDAILQRPIFGYGAGTGSIHTFMESIQMPRITHAHSLYLELLLEGGIISLFCFLLCAVRATYHHIRFLFIYKAGKCYNFACAASLCALLLFGTMDYPLFTPKLVGAFFLIIALCDTVERFSPDPRLSQLQ